jgi:hypothetical protein
MDSYEGEEGQEKPLDVVGDSQLPEIRDSFISKLTSTHERYMNLWYQLRGYAPDIKGNWKYYGKELSGELFANKAVAQFSSIVNDTNSLTRKSEPECKRILHDAVEVFTYDMYLDETIDDSDTFVLAKIYEHNIELFLGLVEAGHGSKVITAILTGQKLEMNNNQSQEISLGDWFRSKR